jgi:hypothetical protein
MAYIAINYANNPNAPVDKWTCAPNSKLGPFEGVPETRYTKANDYCGQCVSYVKQVCPTLPATTSWKQGAQVKDNNKIVAGTVIATFNASGKYEGHAAIYVSQSPAGVYVYDQYVAPPNPKPVGPRTLRWGAPRDVNNGDKFYVVE